MTGPEHYRKAEAILAKMEDGVSRQAFVVTAQMEAAQVHATLALAAATADHLDSLQHPGWWEVTR